jgi:hypothetical protein
MKRGCKGVKLWPPNIIVFKEVKLKEQGQVLHTPKKTTFICLFFYNYSNNSKISHKKKRKKVGFVIKGQTYCFVCKLLQI